MSKYNNHSTILNLLVKNTKSHLTMSKKQQQQQQKTEIVFLKNCSEKCIWWYA